MSCCNDKDCDCHQHSSFIFGLIIGLVIAAVVAIVVYKNNREVVLLKLKKQIEKFISAIGRSASGGKPKSEEIIESFITPNVPRKKIIKNIKKDVVIPKNLIIADTTPKSISSKPRKMFKK